MRKTITGYVVFTPGVVAGRGWWRFFTRRGWRHCYVIIPVYFPEPSLMAEQYAMKIESLAWGVDTEIWWSPVSKCLDHVRPDATAIVSFTVTLPPSKNSLVQGPLSCVSLAKAQLAIRDWKIFTPYQLFRWLVRHGGKVV